jgi:hypothetical protein
VKGDRRDERDRWRGVAWGCTVDALILGLLIDIMEISQNLNRGNMTSRIINHSL